MIKLIAYVIIVFISIFVLGNSILPIFYVLPRFVEFKRKGLAKSIPVLGVVAPTLIWILILYFIKRLFIKILGQESNIFIYGFFTGLVIFIFSLKSQMRTVRAEMYETYKTHFSEKGIEHFFKP